MKVCDKHPDRLHTDTIHFQGDHQFVDVCGECKKAIIDLLENHGERGEPLERGEIFPAKKEHVVVRPELPPAPPQPIISATAEQKAPWWSRFFRRIFKWQTPN